MTFWKTSRRLIHLERPLVMGILNVTPDSFSDGGDFYSPATAITQAEKLIGDGADILDIGGESTRPGSSRVPEQAEIERVLPVVEEVLIRLEIPVSIES